MLYFLFKAYSYIFVFLKQKYSLFARIYYLLKKISFDLRLPPYMHSRKVPSITYKQSTLIGLTSEELFFNLDIRDGFYISLNNFVRYDFLPDIFYKIHPSKEPLSSLKARELQPLSRASFIILKKKNVNSVFAKKTDAAFVELSLSLSYFFSIYLKCHYPLNLYNNFHLGNHDGHLATIAKDEAFKKLTILFYDKAFHHDL